MDPTAAIIAAFRQKNPAIPNFKPGPRGNPAYLFIPNPPRSERGIRHAKCYCDRILDYTVRGTRNYATLEEWAEDCGSTVECIRYGYDTTDTRFPSITIIEFLQAVYPLTWGPPKSEFDELDKNLSKMNLGFESVYVAYDDSIIRAATFNLKFK